MAFDVRTLQKGDDRATFDCGEEPLNTFFRRFAHHHQHKHGISVTWLAVEDSRIGGFITLTATTVNCDQVPSERSFPPLQLPALLIARLGTNIDARGRGVGALLLRTALLTAVRMRRDVGCVGVLVDSKPDAVGFYKRYDFVPTGTSGPQDRLYLPYSAIDDAVG